MASRRLSTRAGAAIVLALVSLAAVPSDAASRAAAAALEHVQRHKQDFGLTGSDVKEVSVSSEVPSTHNGITHVYLQQGHRGIDVYNGILTVNVREDGSVLSAGSRFVSNIASLAGGQSARKAAEEAVGAAAGHLNLKPSKEFRALERKGGSQEVTTLSDGGIAARPIEARLVWFPVGRAVRLAWSVEIEEAGGEHWWIAFVDAETGESLGKDDLIIHDSVEAIGAAVARPDGSPAALSSFADVDGSSYNVFAQPFESPNDGDRTLVTGAASPAASPFGWHDTNAAAGPEYTITRGNNAHAYTDLNADNFVDAGSEPDGGAGLDFDLPLDLAFGAHTYRPFAVTNLFYWNNVMHDVTFGYGFDEEAGNFQTTNYGGAVGGGDYVQAEAQDGSGLNNANFGTPRQNAADPRPRMQMFVWIPPGLYFVTVNGGPAAGDYAAARANFGAQLSSTGPVTGNVVLVNDGVIGAGTPPGTLNDGCEPFSGVSGAIALLDRGFCNFTVKVFNAQTAGAVGVIVANNVAGAPVIMGGADPGITIPALMVSLADATVLKANLPLNATMRFDGVAQPTRDSDLDAGVICHEYGHGISNRLTGGPNIVTCLNNAEQMGEGWSDWFALTLTTHPADTRLTPRGIGPYVIYQPGDGAGIRPTPYTTDMTINPSTYASVANPAISQPHGIGYVWNTMLWEMYWNLVDRHGYNANVYEPWSTGGNNLALQLVMDGMKFQPCLPGFVDGRNAILQADDALTGTGVAGSGANQCEIWRAFAKRGLGASASQGLSTSRTDGVEAFDLPAACTTAVFGEFLAPVQDPPAINSRDAGADVPIKFTLSGAGSSWVVDSQPIDCDTLVPTGEAPIVIATGPAAQSGDRYHVDWATDPAWEGTCRRLTLRIPAATDAVAYFSFH
jgi:extracellular elastinolytic metalloproteinase